MATRHVRILRAIRTAKIVLEGGGRVVGVVDVLPKVRVARGATNKTAEQERRQVVSPRSHERIRVVEIGSRTIRLAASRPPKNLQ
jgi:hypothetical protein